MSAADLYEHQPMIRKFSVLLVLAAMCCLSAAAQTCPTIPDELWLASPDPSEIPPAVDAWLLTSDGSPFLGRANHVVAYVQTGPNEQKVWFYVNSLPHHTKVYYNRRFRSSASDPWKWAWSYSPMVLQFPSPASVSVNAVLYSPTPKYGAGGALYHYAMFVVNQPSTCDNIHAGWAMVSFSNNGTCWTAPVPLRRTGGPSSSCAPELGTDLVSVEAFDVIDAGDRLYFIGLEGNVLWLTNTANMDGTGSTWAWASPGNVPALVSPANPAVTASGILSPDGIPTPNSRFKPYLYFINMAMAWDAAHGDLYLTRGYPYPYDRYPDGSATTPSPDVTDWVEIFNPYLPYRNQHVEGCQGGLAAYPNRIQIYTMHLGSLSNFAAVSTGTWTLVADYGGNDGYTWGDQTTTISRIWPQQGIGRDYGTASFLRNGSGSLEFVSSKAYVFGGQQYLSPLSVGPCRATGFERTYLIQIPGLAP